MTDTSSQLVFVPLSSGLRRGLESSVVEARDVVEDGVGRVFDRLGVERSGLLSSRVPVGLSDGERTLRRVVGVKVRQAGGFDAGAEEIAFGVWHRMLFARFLAENDLLMHPDHNVAVTLDECDELAHAGLGADRWVVASQFAAHMLPGLFPVDDPLSRIELLPEDLHALERILDGIPVDVFVSDDGLGWVYQFWQSRRKDEVNASEVKIGARELPAVTQLFTEHYMVRFLLENSLGAWWAARHLDSPLNEAFEYLRFDEDGVPAAGSFDGWPETVAEVTAMDPCCGSGHFLTSLFEMLWRMRVEEEGLDPVEAQDRVLAENLFGLELDPRCTQIAAFNVALAAWKAGGYRQLPELNIACSGIRVAGSRDSWLGLAGDDPRLRDGLERLHEVFKDADTLGSLIDPKLAVGGGSLLAADFDEVHPLLTRVLERETVRDPAAAVFGQQVTGVAKAADLLSRRYTLVATNPPFLGRGKMDKVVGGYCDANYPDGGRNLATALIERVTQDPASACTCAWVVPSDWFGLAWYEGFRRHFLSETELISIVHLGANAFSTPMFDLNTALVSWHTVHPGQRTRYFEIDASTLRDSRSVSLRLAGDTELSIISQSAQLENPALRIETSASLTQGGSRISEVARVSAGAKPGETVRVTRFFWEIPPGPNDWILLSSSPSGGPEYSGKTRMILTPSAIRLAGLTSFDEVGSAARGRRGTLISKMGRLAASMYDGSWFDDNTYALIPHAAEDLEAVWVFASSEVFVQAVRAVSKKTAVPVGAVGAARIDIGHWRQVAAERYPDGLPEPWSDDPTQWLFLGDPAESTDALQVGVARLLGYSWPDQEPDELDRFLDDDGIVCLPAVKGERPAADRLRELLVAAFDAEDNPVELVDSLLTDADAGGKGLGWWLENRFFKQHHQLFRKRPFIWHVTDGHRDGFSALVNYHQLDRSGLERLTFTYLGWWIDRQRADVARGLAGADDRLAAAEVLQGKLKLILDGEPPHDIYVRWKPLAEQSIGWDPDLDDGVRLNIRPFVEAGVLKIKKPPGIKWGKDRGKNPDGSERLNDLHFTRDERQIARNNT